jgi:hypothetical protein
LVNGRHLGSEKRRIHVEKYSNAQGTPGIPAKKLLKPIFIEKLFLVYI